MVKLRFSPADIIIVFLLLLSVVFACFIASSGQHLLIKRQQISQDGLFLGKETHPDKAVQFIFNQNKQLQETMNKIKQQTHMSLAAFILELKELAAKNQINLISVKPIGKDKKQKLLEIVYQGTEKINFLKQVIHHWPVVLFSHIKIEGRRVIAEISMQNLSAFKRIKVSKTKQIPSWAFLSIQKTNKTALKNRNAIFPQAPLTQLRFLGVISSENHYWALVANSGGQLRKIIVGNQLGEKAWRVTQVTDDQVTLSLGDEVKYLRSE